MHFCADCGQVLDIFTGQDSCPRCGLKNVSVCVAAETVTASVTAGQPGSSSLLSWSLVWLSVAREHVAAAYGARKLFASDPSGALSAEFHAGLVAIGAAAYAVEAEKLRVLGENLEPATPPTRPWDLNQGDWLGQYLVERRSIDATTAEALGQLFDLRNRSVHPVARMEDLVRHPVGTDTSAELVAYNADVAEELVNVANAVVAAVAAISA